MPLTRPAWLRWLPARLSLRGLMVLVLVVGCGLGWFARRWQAEARRAETLGVLQKAQANISFNGRDTSRILWMGGSPNPASLPQTTLTPEQIRALGSCPQLKELVMASAAMTDAGLEAIAHDGLLEQLYCLKPDISDAGVRNLASLTQLRGVDLLRAPRLTDDALRPLAGLQELQQLNLSGTAITGSGLTHLVGLPKLWSLTLVNNPLDDAGLEQVGRLVGLRTLYASVGNYTDAGLSHLARLRNLEKLSIGSNRCTDAGLAVLDHLPRLEMLQVTGPWIGDSTLDRVATVRTLRAVLIDGGSVSEAAIRRFHEALPEAELMVNGQKR